MSDLIINFILTYVKSILHCLNLFNIVVIHKLSHLRHILNFHGGA